MSVTHFYFLATSTGVRPDLVEGLIASFNALELPSNCEASLLMLDQNRARHDAIFAAHPAATGRGIERYYSEHVIGLSKARNILLARLTGDGYVMFCDDDASYPPDFLLNLSQGARAQQWPDIAIFRLLNKGEDTTYGNRKYPSASGPLGDAQTLNLAISLNLAMRLARLRALEGFSEDYGVGSKGLCGEETELVLRFLDDGARTGYLAEPCAWHPSQTLAATDEVKLYNYSLGYRDMLLSYSGSLKLRLLVRAHLAAAILKSVAAFFLRKAERRHRVIKLRGLLGMAAGHQ